MREKVRKSLVRHVLCKTRGLVSLVLGVLYVGDGETSRYKGMTGTVSYEVTLFFFNGKIY